MKMFSLCSALALLNACLALPVLSQSPCETPGPIPFQDRGKWGYLSAEGIVIPARFDFAGFFTTEGAIACAGNECGLLAKNGSFLLPTWDRHSSPVPEKYSEGLAPALRGGKWGYLDYERKITIPFKFKYAGQ